MRTDHATRRALLAALVLLGLALLPARWSAWTNSLSGVAALVIGPVTQPIRGLAGFLAGESRRDNVARLEREIEHVRTLWLQERQTSAELRRALERVQRVAVRNEIPVAPLLRPVVGNAGGAQRGLLLVRAGAADEVTFNTVAATEDLQVIGKVVAVNARTCWVRLITHPATGSITGVVMLDENTPGPTCLLHPFRGSLLQGLVEFAPEASSLTAGQTVRLDDPLWPKSARMLVLGRIVEVRTVATGRQTIIVRPLTDLDRVSEVVLRIPLTPEAAEVEPQPETSR